jgi:FixJ family two-component response regulator
MRELKLLQRLVAALARNEGVQSKRTEILQQLESLSPREVDVLCYVLGGQLNREIAAELGVSGKNNQSSSRACHEKAWRAINSSIIPNGVACAMGEWIQHILQATAPSSSIESKNQGSPSAQPLGPFTRHV